MELGEYARIVQKWWWLLVLCALLFAGTAFLVNINMTPTYEASTLLVIGGGVDVVNPTTGELQTSEKLAQTYAELVKTRPILRAVRRTLDLPHEPTVKASIIRSTQLLRITAVDTEPARAAAIADELARQLIQQSPSGTERQDQAYRQFVDGQLAQIQEEIDSLTFAIQEARVAGQNDTVTRYQGELSLRRDTYSQLLRFLSSSSTNHIRAVEEAAIPSTPTSPKTLQNTALAAVVGLMLAGGIAFLIEYLDTSIKELGDVEKALGLPGLGSIITMPASGNSTATLVSADPLSPYAEGYRMLYTSLRYSVPASIERRVFLVTSPGPYEGKSTITANLAAVIALAGAKAIVVDADMRRPRQHELMGSRTECGLSSLLVGEINDIASVLQKTAIEGLSLLPCGTIPPNPAELLGSRRMSELLGELAKLADVIIMDSPPLLAVADAGILAGLATGTILIAEAGRTTFQTAAHALEILERAKAKPLGIVLNRVDPHGGKGYGYGYYYHYRYTSRADADRMPKGSGLVDRLLAIRNQLRPGHSG
jgi:non-specific protein-tyrosine kinase